MKNTFISYNFLKTHTTLKGGLGRFFLLLFLVIYTIPQQTKADNAEQIITKINEWAKLHPAQANVSAYICNNNVYVVGMSYSLFQLNLNIDTGVTVKWCVAHITTGIVSTFFKLSGGGRFELINNILSTSVAFSTIKTSREAPNIKLLRGGGLINSQSLPISQNNTSNKEDQAIEKKTVIKSGYKAVPTCGSLRVWLSPSIRK